MHQGTINANRLEVEESGDVIRFGQGVTMVMVGQAPDSKTADAVDRRTANAADRRTPGR